MNNTRKHWTEAEKSKIVLEYKNSNVKDVAAKYNIHPQMIYRWGRQFKKEGVNMHKNQMQEIFLAPSGQIASEFGVRDHKREILVATQKKLYPSDIDFRCRMLKTQYDLLSNQQEIWPEIKNIKNIYQSQIAIIALVLILAFITVFK